MSELFAGEGFRVFSASARLNRYLRVADIVWSLVRWARSVDILVVEVYSGPSFVVADIASRLGRRMGCHVVMWLHGGALPEFILRSPRWTKKVLGRADLIVTPSQFLARAIHPFGLQARVIPNVLRLSEYPFRRRRALRPRLFWMRSFHSLYNPLMALRVLARLRRNVPHAGLVMAGQDKGLESHVRGVAEVLGVSGAVSFPGFLDRQGKQSAANECDVYINTSCVDNTPVAVLEACAMGMPVVATAVGGVPHLLKNGETGLLVPDDDDQAMVDAVQRLLRDPQLAARLSENGRKLAEHCSWPTVRGEWERVFAELAARSHPSGQAKAERSRKRPAGSVWGSMSKGNLGKSVD